MTSHFFIPDTQVKQEVPLHHLEAAGNYIVDKQPDVIIHAGDHFDLPSLSSYENKGSSYFEGKRYKEDIEAGKEGMEVLLKPITEHNNRKRKNKEKLYKPRMVFLNGNHENRLNRLLNNEPKLIGAIGPDDFEIEKFGWENHEFLRIVEIDKICYSHYFYNPNTGKPYGGMVRTRLNNIGFSFTQGHQQGKEIAEKHLANGKTLRGLVAGSFYIHDEEYRGHQAHNYWKGCIYKTEVKDGNYCLTELSLDYLIKEWL